MDSNSTQGRRGKNYIPAILALVVLIIASLLILNYFGIITLPLKTSHQTSNSQPAPSPLTTADIDQQLIAFNPTKATVAGTGTSYTFQGTVRSIRSTTQPDSGYVLELNSPKGDNVPIDFFIRGDDKQISQIVKGKEATSSAQNIKVGAVVQVYYFVKSNDTGGVVTKIVIY